MIDISIDNFEEQVIMQSTLTPVLVDFWAPWCGPCKSLGPILEKLEDEYGGRFLLAKINTEVEQQLAGAFGIRSIPTCILMIDGKPVNGFAGALPEKNIREFLDKYVKSEDELLAKEDVSVAEELLAAGDIDSARQKLQEALTINPANGDARYDLVKLFLQIRDLESAHEYLNVELLKKPMDPRFLALHYWLDALLYVQDHPQLDLPQLEQVLHNNKRDFVTRLAKVKLLMANESWSEAMDELLEIIMRDKKWENDSARKMYISILEILTSMLPKTNPQTNQNKSVIAVDHAKLVANDPQAELISKYRRKLSMVLN
ncbi:MAG: thioredoxin [Gammaproteobacteria bacterium]|nr:thioredoxin [Gammaproteobacteria bacterium]